jgi:hypothetical protein
LAPVLSEIADSLDNSIRDGLQRTSHRFFLGVLLSAFVVVVGVVLEGPEILHEMWPRRFICFTGGSVSRIRKFKRLLKIAGLFGWLLVVVGVAGEDIFEGLQNRSEGQLQTFNDLLLREARLNAGTAKQSAIEAAGASTRAREEAQGARNEADSLGREVISVKQQAADAGLQLTEALKQAVALTAELQRLKSPRSLTDIPKLTDTLRALRGTEYTLNVFQDDESIRLTRAVDEVLRKAGWIRKQPEITRGVPALVLFNADNKEPVPVCVETGILIHLQAEESLEIIQKHGPHYLPKDEQAAATLLAAFGESLSPSDDHNVNFVHDAGPRESLTICVGKKP